MIYSFLYVLAASMGLVLTEFMDQSIPPSFSLFFASLITIIFFNIINLKKIKQMYIECWQQKNTYLLLMFSVSIIWMCCMYGPELVGASLFNFLFFGCIGILGFSSTFLKTYKESKSLLYIVLGILILIASAIYIELHILLNVHNLLGIFLPLFGGIVSFIYFKQSQLLMKKTQLSATQILAVRFYFTIIISFATIPGEHFYPYLTIKNLSEIIVFAFLTMIIQLYFVQKALEKISTEKNSIIISLTPGITGLFQEAVFGNVTWPYIIIYFLYVFLIVLSIKFKKNYS